MRGLIIVAIAALGACAVPDEAGDQNEMASAQSAPAMPAQNDVAPEPVKQAPGEPPSTTPVPSSDDGEACGASQYQYLVGQPRSSIPEQPQDASWRIACSSCPVTMDYSPSRMNIFYDEETEIIEEVKCG